MNQNFITDYHIDIDKSELLFCLANFNFISLLLLFLIVFIASIIKYFGSLRWSKFFVNVCD